MSGEGFSKKKHVGWLQVSQPASGVPSKDINNALIPYMADLVHSFDSSYWLPATVWFCGLLSGEDPPVEKVLASRVVHALLLFLTEENLPELQVEAAKALKYIASGTSKVTRVTINKAVNSAQDALWHLMHSKDNEVLGHACCSLAVLSGCENVKVRELILESDLYNRLLELIRHPTLVVAALRTLGNVVEGDEYMIDCIIRDEILFHLRSCLAHKFVDVRKEACWMLSYITAGKGRWIQAVLDAELIEQLVNMVRNDKFVVMEAAIRAISNATSGATHEQIRLLVSKGCIEAMCYQFCCRNSEIFKVCLDGLETILEEAGDAEKRNEYALHIDSIDGWDILFHIASAYEKELFKKAINFLVNYGPISPSLVKEYLHGNHYYDYLYPCGYSLLEKKC